MRRDLALALLLGWLLGIGTGLVAIAVGGGWYEYTLINSRSAPRLVNSEGWQVVQVMPRNQSMGQLEDSVYLRRPRLRLP